MSIYSREGKEVYSMSASKFADKCKICFDSIRGKRKKEKVGANGGLLPINLNSCRQIWHLAMNGSP